MSELKFIDIALVFVLVIDGILFGLVLYLKYEKDFLKKMIIWRKLEIVVAFVAFTFFALHDYQRADFLMLFLIYNRLIKETK